MERINIDIILKIWSYVGKTSLCLTISPVREKIYKIMNSFKEKSNCIKLSFNKMEKNYH